MSWKRWGIVRVSAMVALLSTMMVTSLFLGQDRSPAPPAPPPAAEVDAAAPELAPAPDAEAGAAPPVLRDWIAFGSGCRARSDEPGDVAMERITVVSGARVIHRARFRLEHYRLTTEERGAGQPLGFARECAVRVQLGPPAGKRIARASARTGVVSTKAEGVKLTILAELKIGIVTLGRKVLVHEADTAHELKKELFRLSPDMGSGERFPELACGEGKLVGFDSTWIAERKTPFDEVFVELSGERALDLDIELADC